MTIVESVMELDLSVFRFINSTLAAPILDSTMPTVTGYTLWIVLAVFAIVLARIKTGSNNIFFFIIFALACLALSDFLSFYVFKHFFQRLRPCYDLAQVRTIVSCGGSLSFPSNHAANSMAVFFFTFLVFQRWWALLSLTIPLLISFSRVYLGVHYPTDVLGGMALGIFVACGIYLLLKKTPRWSHLVDKPFLLRKTNQGCNSGVTYRIAGQVT